MKTIRELRRRGVFRVVALYIVAAWVVLQVADLAFAGLGIPEIAIRYVWIATILGIPIALVFGWRYDITSEGIIRTPPAESEATYDVSLRGFDYVLLSSLMIIGAIITVGLLRELPGPDFVASSEPHPMSLAVLPLANLSRDPDQEFFVAGMHDSLITVLSKIGGLRVTSRTSSARFAETDKPISAIAKELRVAMIVEGSVYRVDDDVRIILQLIQSATDEHLWAESYDRNIRDVLALQNEIALAVADAVEVTLTPDESERLGDPGRVDPETYELYQQGLFQYRQFTPDSVARSEHLFQSAIDADPGFARAYVGLGLARQYSWEFSASTDRAVRDAIAQSAVDAASQALALDPNLAEAYLIPAYIGIFVAAYKSDGRKAVQRALELSPSLAMAHSLDSFYLQNDGNHEDAIRQWRIALQLDPLNELIVAQGFAPLYSSNRMDEALMQIQQAVDMNPENPFYRVYRGRVLVLLGRYDDALADYRYALPAIPESNWFHAWAQVFVSQAHAMAGDVDEAQRWLKIIKRRSDGYVPPVGLAMIHTAMNEHDAAIEQLELGFEKQEEQITWILHDPVFDPLRENPRFLRLHDKVAESL